MPNKKIALTYEGDSQLIDAAIEALAKNEGWSEETGATKEDYAKQRVNNYIRSEVLSYNLAQAQNEVAAALSAAVEQVSQQSTAALDAITVALEVE
jgi:hypothetical protein